MIENAVFETADNSSIRLTRNGSVYSVPVNVGNRHYRIIQVWLAEGNVIDPYVAPPPPTKGEKITDGITNHAIMNALVKALAKQLNITEAQLTDAIEAEL